MLRAYKKLINSRVICYYIVVSKYCIRKDGKNTLKNAFDRGFGLDYSQVCRCPDC